MYLTEDLVDGAFKRGEGIWFDSGIVYVATTSDNRIHADNTRTEKIRVLYDGEKLNNRKLTNPDNITVSRSGDLFVCDNSSDGTPFDICILTPGRSISRLVAVTGPPARRSQQRRRRLRVHRGGVRPLRQAALLRLPARVRDGRPVRSPRPVPR